MHRYHSRRSIRLKGYDYSWPGWYYVTFCIEGRRCLFGKVIHDIVERSPLGETAQQFWLDIPKHHKNVELDDFVVMPDHIHGIIVINSIENLCGENLCGDSLCGDNLCGDNLCGDNLCGDVQLNVPTSKVSYSILSPKKGSLGVIMRTYKAAVTTWARQSGHPDFRWISRFYEHIIRNDRDLDRIRRYIANNPRRWALKEQSRGKARVRMTTSGISQQ